MLLARQLVRSAFKVRSVVATFQGKQCYSSSSFVEDISHVNASKVRNIGIIAHIDAGKTTTTERMIYYSGLSSRIGNVDEGDTVTDYLTQERDRGITIQSAAVTIPWNNHKINIIDTPGHADFTFEVIRSLRVLDGAVTILDAVAGVEAQTEKVWKQSKDLGIPLVAYINKMDREGAGFGRTVKEIVSRLGTRVVLVNIPYFEEDPATKQMIFKGIIDVFDKKLLLWDQATLKEDFTDGKKVQAIDLTKENQVRPEVYEQLLKSREAAVEQLGEFDEDVINSFFETEDYMAVPSSILKKALRQCTLNNDIVPILCGASFKNIGVQPLLDAVNNYLPSPLDITAPKVIASELPGFSHKKKKNHKGKNGDKSDATIPVVINKSAGCVVNNNPNLTSALAFKVLTHPNRGIMVFVRVYSGKLLSTSSVFNSRTGEKVKIGKLLLMQGETPQEVKFLSAGDIGVITGTDKFTTGDTILAHSLKKEPTLSPVEKHLTLLPIEIPPPVFSVSLLPYTIADKRKLEASLEILIREDPSLHLHEDEETGQLILSGMGELHLEIAKDRLVTDMQVKAEIGNVQVTYKETITSSTNIISNNVTIAGESKPFEISLSLESFEGSVESTPYADLPDSHILSLDNNIAVFEPESYPAVVKEAIAKDVWGFPVSFERVMSMLLLGVTSALQVGGTVARLPLHSVAVRIHSFSYPTDSSNISPFIALIRQTIQQALEELPLDSKTMMEPYMKLRVYVSDEDLGVVTQDLMSARNAIIHSIDEDTSDTSKDTVWAKELAENTYVPYDPTSKYAKTNVKIGKKIILADAPLREMVGYLPKLRSVTKGRGIYDMEYDSMHRANSMRVKQLLDF